MVNQEKVRAYLARIGFDLPQGGTLPAPTYETLRVLQHKHLQTVPYENLDIMRDISIDLAADAVYEKIVSRNRGGYCFELNGLFAWLLRQLGYGVAEYFGRFLRNETVIPMRRHRILHVTCPDGEYVCDVGVGQAIPREPLPLKIGVPCELYGETYQLERDDFLGYVLTETYKGGWRNVYSFTTEPQIDADFEAVHFYCEKFPASYFRSMDMVHMFTPNGRKVVAGRELKIFTPEGVTVREYTNDGEYYDMLQREFGIGGL
jgi:N-hydroxyarylamine O-acetyltransferase